MIVLALLSMAAPYVVMKALTNFDNGESTRSQRVWIILWLVLSQVSGVFILVLQKVGDRGGADEVINLLATLFLSPASIGGFVVVGKMMLGDQVCVIV